jgi:hypothetical protein
LWLGEFNYKSVVFRPHLATRPSMGVSHPHLILVIIRSGDIPHCLAGPQTTDPKFLLRSHCYGTVFTIQGQDIDRLAQCQTQTAALTHREKMYSAVIAHDLSV